MPITRPAVMLCLAVPLLACSGILGLDDPDLSISLWVDPSTTAQVELDVRVGGRAWRLDSPGSVDVEAPGAGDHDVVAVLRAIEGDTLVRSSFAQTFRRDSDHWIVARVGGTRPVGFCLGEVSAHPVGGGVADTVFLMHGSLPKDAVC